MTKIYQATLSEVTHFSRIHREGVLLLPLRVGRLWQGQYLEVRELLRVLQFRVARRSQVMDLRSADSEITAAACFPTVYPEELLAWWRALPHGLQSRAMAVWVWVRKPVSRAFSPSTRRAILGCNSRGTEPL